MEKQPHDKFDICRAKTRAGTPCKRPAGWGTDHPGTGRCKLHGGKSTGPPSNNKNAVKTGEHEAIWFDALDEEEKNLVQGINTSKIQQLEEEIRLTTIRERRMLQRVQRLREHEFTTVKITSGIEKGKTTDLEEQQGTLGQIQSIEEALTRVQAHKARLIELKHRLEMDGDSGENDSQAIQDFIKATSKTQEEVAFMFEGDGDAEAKEAAD